MNKNKDIIDSNDKKYDNVIIKVMDKHKDINKNNITGKSDNKNMNKDENKYKNNNINKIIDKIIDKNKNKNKANNINNINNKNIIITNKYVENYKDKKKVEKNDKDKNIDKERNTEKPNDKSKEPNEYSPQKLSKDVNKINFNNSFTNNNNNNQKVIKQKNKPYINTENINTYNLNKTEEQNTKKENDNKLMINIPYNNVDNNNNINNSKETNNSKNIEIQNTNEKKETKVTNGIGTIKTTDYTLNHHQLSFKPKIINKKNHILKIRNNEKLTILNRKLNTNSTSINTDDDVKEEKKRVYKISSNVVNEQYYKDKFIEREINTDEENLLTISMQSLNDSNIMEIANRYITEDEGLDKNEVNEILNIKKDKLL